MENSIMLHQDPEIFNSAVKETSDSLNIRDFFIEKDYWITLVLKRLSESEYVDSVVFKGGTSLSKAFGLIDRFSEDIDLAVVNNLVSSGNQIKNLIRDIEKEIAGDLKEIETPGVTSKGSRFRKSVFHYPSIFKNAVVTAISDKLIVEINSFANPYPYQKVEVQSIIGKFYQSHNATELVEKYNLHPFHLNVLDKRQTMLEKVVSLVRFSFDENPVKSITGKIRHFYDLFYLLSDEDCTKYVESENFKKDFINLIEHDKIIFNDPAGWSQKDFNQSVLITNFDELWDNLKASYRSELLQIAFSKIPDEKEVRDRIKTLIDRL